MSLERILKPYCKICNLQGINIAVMQTIQYRNHETFEDNEFLKSMELLLRLYVSKIEINSMVIA